MLERDIKKQILCYLQLYSNKNKMLFWNQDSTGLWDKNIGTFRKKNSKFQINGIPDIMVIKNYYELRVFICLEVKTDTGVQSKNQINFQNEIESINGYYFIVRSIEDVIKCFEIVQNSVEIKLNKLYSDKTK